MNKASTARTSIVMDANLLFQLRQHSKQTNSNVSQVIEEAVREKLEKTAETNRAKTYKSLWKLKDSMKNVQVDPRYKDMSVDEILYGEKGAWSTNNQEANE